MPETRQQCRKLKERCLLAEIKLLRSSMGAMKSGIQMEAAGRVGADTRIPYPRADYGQGKLVAEPCATKPESLPSTGKQKISSDWEELDLRSNSPSATSVQECARLKLFSNGNRGGRELMAKEVIFLSKVRVDVLRYEYGTMRLQSEGMNHVSINANSLLIAECVADICLASAIFKSVASLYILKACKPSVGCRSPSESSSKGAPCEWPQIA